MGEGGREKGGKDDESEEPLLHLHSQALLSGSNQLDNEVAPLPWPAEEEGHTSTASPAHLNGARASTSLAVRVSCAKGAGS